VAGKLWRVMLAISRYRFVDAWHGRSRGGGDRAGGRKMQQRKSGAAWHGRKQKADGRNQAGRYQATEQKRKMTASDGNSGMEKRRHQHSAAWTATWRNVKHMYHSMSIVALNGMTGSMAGDAYRLHQKARRQDIGITAKSDRRGVQRYGRAELAMAGDGRRRAAKSAGVENVAGSSGSESGVWRKVNNKAYQYQRKV